MPKFTYSAINPLGVEKSGRLEAPDVRQAAARLQAQGLIPTKVTLGEVVASTATHPMSMRHRPGFGFAAVRTKELAGFTRQLGTLTRAGIPLLRGLEVLGRQERNRRFRVVIETIAGSIKSGDTLSEALAPHPRIFDHLYVNMIKAGEASGSLDVVLDRLARFQEKNLRLRGQVVDAMVYPVIVLSVALTVLCGLLVYVVPKFQQIFADMLRGAPLPPLTEAVLRVSNLVRHNLLLLVIIAVIFWLAFSYFRRTANGTRLIDATLLKLPGLGGLVLKTIVARVGRTLGSLLSSGVPILPALLITRDTCGNIVVSDAINAAHDRVKAGASVSRSLEATAVFPPMLTSMIEVGEHTGQLADMLNKIADIYDAEVDSAFAGLGAFLEPILIIFPAVIVGTIVIALILPILRIVQLLS